MVDAANPCVFVRSEDLGVIGTETPEILEADAGFLERMEAVRRTASVAMGIASDLSQAAKIPSIPKVCVVSETQDQNLLTGEKMRANFEKTLLLMRVRDLSLVVVRDLSRYQK